MLKEHFAFSDFSSSAVEVSRNLSAYRNIADKVLVKLFQAPIPVYRGRAGSGDLRQCDKHSNQRPQHGTLPTRPNPIQPQRPSPPTTEPPNSIPCRTFSVGAVPKAWVVLLRGQSPSGSGINQTPNKKRAFLRHALKIDRTPSHSATKFAWNVRACHCLPML